VKLSGRVLRHAQPSLDSLSVVTSQNIYLGAFLTGAFTDSSVRIYNAGWTADQARLVPTSASVTGGGGRFSVVAFAPDTLGGVGRTWGLHFDDAGATVDSVYNATVTFQTSDEALPGATTLGSLQLFLQARPSSSLTGVPAASLPQLRFYAARPNPLARETSFAFDLPAPATASLEIFDLSGRRVAQLAGGEQSAGRHDVRWQATDAGGARVAGGLYFARFATRGLTRTERVVVLP
jgi:hypothetical protein